MLNKFRFIRVLILIITLGVIVSCPGSPPGEIAPVPKIISQHVSIDINTFADGTEIRNAGLQLMDKPYGMLSLNKTDQFNDSVLVVTVHGYQSQGYEWITGLKNLTDHFGSLFFFRYDWERCPEVVAAELASEIKAINQAGTYKRVVIFGHSYGGLVVTYAASQLGSLNAELNVIAAPLSGFPSLLDQCASLKHDEHKKLIYPEWDKSVQLIQYRTVHGQDGAFRDLEIDPQAIDLPFYRVQVLPPTMDGHRLGHNWSVTWVLDQYVGKHHRY